MIAEKLRKAILQAAMQGKLTKQLPEDGDARDLLAEIQEEKKQWAKAGVIRASKPLPYIDPEDVPYEIPQNWVWTRLEDMSEIVMGQSPPGQSVNMSIGIEFHQGKIHFGRMVIGRSKFKCTQPKKEAKIGSVLLCVRAPVGIVNLTDRDICIGRGLASLLVYSKVSNLFLFYYLQTQTSGFEAQATGSTFKAINLDIIRKTLIPLPPAEEQKRLVSNIQVLMRLVDELERAEDELDALEKDFPEKLKKSLLQAAMQGKLTEQLPEDGDARDLLAEIQQEKKRKIRAGEIKAAKPLPPINPEEVPYEIPSNWVWSRIDDVSEIVMGQSPPGESVNLTTGMEFHQGKIHFEDVIIGKSKFQCTQPKKVARPGSVLLCVRAPVGIVNITDRTVCIGRGLASLLPLKNINSYFIFYYLQTQSSIFEAQATGSTFKAINSEVINNTLISLPPINEQKRIATILDEMLLLLQHLKKDKA